ncbi:hypothetical protein IFM89_009056 [Coptis chinensis]|uniref:Uncharacterized protein n=1 Tax=Coptis chinensis TaxID=261450 RepID=A0A835IM26_9MAGN|nr:hypothetical protein IFM89_009056 [Coptis chinensis]
MVKIESPKICLTSVRPLHIREGGGIATSFSSTKCKTHTTKSARGLEVEKERILKGVGKRAACNKACITGIGREYVLQKVKGIAVREGYGLASNGGDGPAKGGPAEDDASTTDEEIV